MKSSEPIISFAACLCFLKGEINDFIEIFIDAPFHECVKRDTKGWYKRALNGEIESYTGVDSPYEKPEKPDVHIKAGESEAEEAVKVIINFLEYKINF